MAHTNGLPYIRQGFFSKIAYDHITPPSNYKRKKDTAHHIHMYNTYIYVGGMCVCVRVVYMTCLDRRIDQFETN